MRAAALASQGKHTLLTGEYNEATNHREFQQAVQGWRATKAAARAAAPPKPPQK